MRATWKFRACKLRSEYSWIRRKGACNTINGTEHDALEFARRCVEHFRGHDVVCVEAWSVGDIQEQLELPGLVTFQIVPREDGEGWRALEGQLHHGGIYRPHQLGFAIDYAMWRGGGQLSAVTVTNRGGLLERVVLADRRGKESCPCTGPSVRGYA
jgi:hypothetical protein